tara:strand:- start:194 stop:712 length:519 start_codon:yes stop_codon:yes gene_type:complete
MSLLDNIKSNFLGNRNSFNVTFNNKSPLSYVGSESLPGHGSSIQTQLKAPKVSDVYKAHSPKDYLAAETEKYHAIGDATEAFVNFLGTAATGGEGKSGEFFSGGGDFTSYLDDTEKANIREGTEAKRKEESSDQQDQIDDLKDENKRMNEYYQDIFSQYREKYLDDDDEEEG